MLVEIETDKAAIELPAPISGFLKQILKNNGDDAAVGDIIGLMEEGEAPAGAEAPKAEAQPAPAPAAEKPAAAPPPSPQPAPAPEPPPAATNGAPPVMPAAQRILAEAGIDPATVTGSGKGGRILKEDAQRAAAAKPASAPAEPQARPAPEAPKAPPTPSSEPGREEEVVSMTPMRKVIARNLVNAQQNAALLTTFNEVDMGEVMAIRKRYKESFIERHGRKARLHVVLRQGGRRSAEGMPLRSTPALKARTSSTASITTLASRSAAGAAWWCRSCATPRI